MLGRYGWMLLLLLLLVGCRAEGVGPSPTPSRALPTPTASGAVRLPAATATPSAPTPPSPTPAPTRTPAPPSPTAAAWPCPDGAATLTLWHRWDGQAEATLGALLDEYAQRCPEVTVTVAAGDMAALASAGAAAPDLLLGSSADVVAAIQQGLLRPLDPYLERPALESSLRPVARNAALYEGQLWMVPLSLEVPVLLFNRALIAPSRVPTSTTQLLSMARAWQESDYLFVYDVLGEPALSVGWWQAAGATLLAPDGPPSLQAGQAAGEFLADLREVMPEEADAQAVRTLFLNGQAALTLGNQSLIGEIEMMGIDYGVALLPLFSPTARPARPFVTARGLLLTAQGAARGHAPAATNLMRFLARPEAQQRLAAEAGLAPSDGATAQRLATGAESPVALRSAQAEQGDPLPLDPRLEALWGPLSGGTGCIWRGAATIPECLAQSERELGD